MWGTTSCLGQSQGALTSSGDRSKGAMKEVEVDEQMDKTLNLRSGSFCLSLTQIVSMVSFSYKALTLIIHFFIRKSH